MLLLNICSGEECSWTPVPELKFGGRYFGGGGGLNTGTAKLLLSEAGSSIAESEEGEVGLDAPESVLEAEPVGLKPRTCFLFVAGWFGLVGAGWFGLVGA